MTNKYVEKINQSYKNGLLNEYMVKRLLDATQDGITDSLSEELINDAQYASDVGVENDRDYNIYFFILRFADDILDDTFGMRIEPERKKDLCHYMMSHKKDKNYGFDNFTDYRLLIHKWLCDRLSKKAHPNTSGKENREIMYDVDRWIGTLKDIYASIHSKQLARRDAINHFTEDWDTDEKQKFENWMRYYEDGTTEKYNVKTAKINREALIPQPWINQEDRADDKMNISTRKEKREQTRREKELDKAKGFKFKMKSRLRAFKRLLEKYNDILPKQDLDKIYNELYSLEKSVSKLDVYASLLDCVIRSANRIEKFGFKEGAKFLHKLAENPTVGEDIVKSLPPAASKEPDLPPQSAPMLNVQTIISRLEAIGKALKSRDMIRELASIDILLNEMGLSSFFPELTDGQSKLIEAFGYTSNKVESIIAKLRGSGKTEPATSPAPPAPIPSPTPAPKTEPIDTGELLTKPVGKVEKKLPTG